MYKEQFIITLMCPLLPLLESLDIVTYQIVVRVEY